MSKNILLIEDEPESVYRTIRELQEVHNVSIATNISAAESLLRTNKFDFIVLDIMMPPGNYNLEETDGGIETGYIFYDRELRNIDSKIIVWTRNSRISEKDWDKNVVGIYYKSWESSQLKEIIENNS